MKLHRKQALLISAAAVLVIAVIVFVFWKPFKVTKDVPFNITASDFNNPKKRNALTSNDARLIIINDFHATKLNNNRNIHIYLPPSYYNKTDLSYPVLYVHDGKSIFENSDWSKESLNMHTQADALISEGKIKEIIIVGIDNIGENRVGEYSLWDGVDQGKQVTGLGLQHEDFILNDLKPFIDANFRTLPDRENTALMGSSIGGFSTFNTGFRHPEIFSKLAMQSPYLGWGGNKLYKMISDGPYKDKQDLKIWMDVGTKEGDFVDMTAQGLLQLLDNGYIYVNDIAAYEDPNGEHSEKFWSERVKSILLYFYGNIGKPLSVDLYFEGQLSLSDPVGKHLNPVVTYDSGFKMTDLLGSYEVQKPEILRIDNYGSGLYPLAEGVTEVTFKTSTGLTAKTTISIVK